MRRRRLLALGAAVGLGGCSGYVGSIDDEVPDRPSFEVEEETPTRTAQAQARGMTPSVGGSLNERPHRLEGNLELIGESNTTWIHAFLDIREKYDADVDPQEDPDVAALRQTGRETGVRFIVSLMWDFKGNFTEKEKVNVPQSGSAREEALFEYATDLLEAIVSPVDMIVLGNEPTWETPEEDITGSDLPVVSFTRNLKDHLVEQYAGDPRLLLGSFNKLYEEYVREEQFPRFHQQFFEMARTDDDIDGIDLHVHYDGIEEAEEMLAVGREKVPDGTIVATEFSPVWRYDRYVEEPIGEFEAGKRFADRYDIDADLTAVEYFEVAKDAPRSPEQLGDFYDAMPWYNVNFIEDMYALLEKYAVSVSTISFLLGTGMRNPDWRWGWTPFHINFLFQQALLDSEYGAHPRYMDDYRDRA